MTISVEEYDAIMKEKGTPKVWAVNYAFVSPSLINVMLFATEEEARAFSEKVPILISVGETWDIWNWTNKNKREA